MKNGENLKMSVKDVKATRMELLGLRKRIKLAKKGHKLLKEKRDALISEFFSIIDDLDRLRTETETCLNQAFKALVRAQIVLGVSRVKHISQGIQKEAEIHMGFRSVVGVRIPVFEIFEVEKDIKERGYSLISTSACLDDAVRKFEEALALIVELAEIEESARILADEINKTKRKVNALEYILIPQLEEKASYIEMTLEEIERETFARLKVIKSRLEKRDSTDAV